MKEKLLVALNRLTALVNENLILQRQKMLPNDCSGTRTRKSAYVQRGKPLTPTLPR
jgi:hypothetical protein